MRTCEKFPTLIFDGRAAGCPGGGSSLEIERAAAASLAVVAGEHLGPHAAHLLVTLSGSFERSMARAEMLVRCCAAVASAMPAHAVGVYFGEAGLAHPTSFFLTEAASSPPLAVLAGVRLSVDAHGARRLVGVGTAALGLPDLSVSIPASEEDALDMFLAALTLLAERGYGLPPGDTIGRDEREQWRVRYTPSPSDARRPVMCLDLQDGER